MANQLPDSGTINLGLEERAKRPVGRPTEVEYASIKVERAIAGEQQRLDKPPVRQSARLKERWEDVMFIIAKLNIRLGKIL